MSPAAAATSALAVLCALPAPAAFCAVTSTRMRWPASASTRTWETPVAPATGTHPDPSASQRSHCRAKPLGEPSQPPDVAASCAPTRASPDSDGTLVPIGALCVWTVSSNTTASLPAASSTVARTAWAPSLSADVSICTPPSALAGHGFGAANS